MLYTLSQAQQSEEELTAIFSRLTEQDAVILWQNGVLQAVKNHDFFAKYPQVFVLETDLNARGLSTDLATISLEQLVDISERFYPQIAL